MSAVQYDFQHITAESTTLQTSYLPETLLLHYLHVCYCVYWTLSIVKRLFVFMYCICSKNNIPVFNLNYERKNLALQVTVNNMNGDDAYEAKLVGNFPEMLSYSGVRSHQMVNTYTSEKIYIGNICRL